MMKNKGITFRWVDRPQMIIIIDAQDSITVELRQEQLLQVLGDLMRLVSARFNLKERQ